MFRRLLVAPIVVYQRVISPVLPRRCRFHPTCSQYAVEAILTHGALRGGWMATKRLLKCHPLHPGGYDPVPTKQPLAGTADRGESDDQARERRADRLDEEEGR